MRGWERGKGGRKEGSGGALEERGMSGVVTTAIAAAVRHSALPLLALPFLALPCLAFPVLSFPRPLSLAPLSLRATSHTRLTARDQCTLSTLVGGKGGAGPTSLLRLRDQRSM
jgi:hypothetical protein